MSKVVTTRSISVVSHLRNMVLDQLEVLSGLNSDATPNTNLHSLVSSTPTSTANTDVTINHQSAH